MSEPATALRLLGPVQIERAGQWFPPPLPAKSLAMLGYLARQPRPVLRSRLAELLWPDKSLEQGRANVRWALNKLSQLMPGCFEVTPKSIQFSPTPDLWLDTTAFERLLVPRDIASLTEALSLYRGEFMADLSLDDCPEFELWLIRERQLWRQQAIQGLERLIDHHSQAAEYSQAQRWAEQLLELEPWHEETHRRLMRLLALSGQRNAALAQYRRCRQLLAEALEAEPMPETVALYEQIRAGELGRGQPTSSPATLPPCPYRGLFFFREEDAPFFFGREVFTRRLVEAVQQRSLVAVIGPSGSGKSSVVFAGLLPFLKAEGGRSVLPAALLLASFRPGRQPFQALAGALLSLLEPRLSQTPPPVEIQKLAERLCRRQVSLAEVVGQIRQQNPGAGPLLLVADEFEELYTLELYTPCAEPEVRQQFIETLLEASQLPPSTFCLVLTMRADFMGQALADRPFADALQDADLKLGPMTHSELSQAIESPARRQSVVFETGLVERILDDVGTEPGNLPLLEFALTLLWSQQTDSRLTHVAYETIGRITGALAHYADEIYRQLNQSDQERARQIFTQLVQPGVGTEDTRRVARRTELGERNWPLVQRLAKARLIVTNQDLEGQETAEVVHEALTRNWAQLQSWMAADRAFRTWQERLRLALRQWQASQQDEEALLRGVLLAEAEEWAKSRAADWSPVEQEFLEASIALRQRRSMAAEAQRQRELVQSQALAEAAQQRAEIQATASRRLRWLLVGLTLVLLAAVGAGLLAISQTWLCR
ncbi:MAG: BTAD domain-containing putative transcriptional regulator [Chloroflexota bacterium]